MPPEEEPSEVQDGLTPISGTPFYMTPTTPADPMDCNRYPDSPFCGNPITNSPLELSTEIVQDECNIGIQVNGALAFVKLAPVQIVYRNPVCRIQKKTFEPIEYTEEPEQPEPPPDGEHAIYIWCPIDIIHYKLEVEVEWDKPPIWFQYMSQQISIDMIEKRYETHNDYTYFIGWDIHYTIDYYLYYFEPESFKVDDYGIKFLNFNEQGVHKYPEDGYDFLNIKESEWYDLPGDSARISDNPDSHYEDMLRKPSYVEINPDYTPRSDTQYLSNWNGDGGFPNYDEYETPKGLVKVKPGEVGYNVFGVQYREYKYTVDHPTLHRVEKWKSYVCYEDVCIFENPLKEPPYPYMRKCCPDNSYLLKKIYKEVKKANKRIGSDEFPATVPESLLKQDGKESGTKQIENLGSLIAWFAERMDELIGEFEIPIEIEDADLLKDGDQKLSIKLPNIAEAIAEIFSLVLNNSVNQDVILAMATKALVESGSSKQVATKNNYLLESIVDYLAFKTKDKVIEMPMTFTPGAQDFSLMLQEKYVEVLVTEYDDKTNLQKTLTELLFAGAVIRGAFYRRIENPSIAKQEIQDNIFRALQIKKNLEDVERDGTKEIEEYIKKLTDNGNGD
ncbi:hypothetical protein BC008_41495 [Mastigocoleus testarum BC008]|uniref:Uncharacterized protein n=2 Tax=Mastigocoleus TaxID=996924 RepID=A0A0V7ZI04_9CYAN|nr:hypothetical protein BC008_40520 [Mastigocoleus testarum BC008]KST64791.1 hypothetical protein BC008_41495 [Mastigocoleus testarum BC008]